MGGEEGLLSLRLFLSLSTPSIENTDSMMKGITLKIKNSAYILEDRAKNPWDP